MPLYGDKTPSQYVCIDLNLAENYCLTILHVSVKKGIQLRYLMTDF